MDIRDVFGTSNSRPEHADFWRMSEIVLALDAKTERRETQEGADLMGVVLSEHMDSDSATYLAIQRAMRVVQVEDPFDAMRKWGQIAALATAYLEGMIVGATFMERGGRQEPVRRHRLDPQG